MQLPSHDHAVVDRPQGGRFRTWDPGSARDPSLGEANGAGLWVSPGSDENEIVGSIFEDIATHAIVLEGDRNVVQTQGGSGAVRDLGIGNRVSRPDSG